MGDYLDRLKRIERYRRKFGEHKDSPVNYFFYAIRKADTLVEAIKEHIKDKKILEIAVSQSIVSLVTGLEVYCKDTLADLVDKGRVDDSKLVGSHRPKYTLDEIKYISEHNISLGDLISSSYNFQNLHEIQKSFSLAMGSDFFHEIKHHKLYIDYDEGGSVETVMLPDNIYDTLQKVIECRHKVVHEVDYGFTIPTDDFDELSMTLLDFVLVMDDMISEAFNQQADDSTST